MKDPSIITMCGSTKFKTEHLREAKRLREEYLLVFELDGYSHADGYNDQLTPADLEKLDLIHRLKILVSDAIFVVNVGGYIGNSTAEEIEFAKHHGKEIMYLVDPDDGGKEAEVN